MASLFFSYSHADESLRNELEKHLAMLKHEGAITTWHDRRIIAGDPVDDTIGRELEAADVILLLVSSDFLSSKYCYSIEMKRAVARHETGQARVIPIILRPCDWHSAPFGKLLASPPDGKPVTKWADPDEAFLEIAKAVRTAVAIKANPTRRRETATARMGGEASSINAPIGPRSSNLRMRKTFTEREHDAFLDDAFEFMARLFENSLAELQQRNPGIEGTFKRVDATRFTATVYRSGKALARCTIRLGGMFGGITLSLGANHGDNSYNESLTVKADEQTLYLKSLGFGALGSRDPASKLSQEGAAEYYWSLFIEPLQH